jgi:hypothetical protein
MRRRSCRWMVSTGHLSGAADFGARVGCSWREIDEQDTDFETIIRDLSQASTPIRCSSRTLAGSPLGHQPGPSEAALLLVDWETYEWLPLEAPVAD